MLKHHILLSLRNFKRNKTTFLINLIGLTIGLAGVVLISLWVLDEYGVDRYHENEDRLYQVLQNVKEGDQILTLQATQGRLAKALAEEIPEVEFATSVIPASWFPNTGLTKAEGNAFRARPQYVEPDFFNIFSFELIAGNKSSVFVDKYSVAISEELAQKLFKTKDNLIGKGITWEFGSLSGDFTVQAVFRNPPANSSNPSDILFNYELYIEDRHELENWGNSDPHTYLVLAPGASSDQVNLKIRDFLKVKVENSESSLFLQKFSDRYLQGTFENGKQAGGRIGYVRLFSIIAIFILVIASINFINLTTAKASKRAKEIGIKKSFGVAKSSLISQFLTESVLLTSIATLCAILLVQLAMPQFNIITGKQLSLSLSPMLMLGVLMTALLVGVLAGSYPAFYISGIQPIAVFKNKLPGSWKEISARRGLVVFQFTLSVLLIVSVAIVHKQLEYIQTKNLGYQRENVLRFQLEMPDGGDENFFEIGGGWENRVEGFIGEVEKVPGVIKASNAYHNLTGNHGGMSGVDWKAGDEDEKLGFSNLEIGYGFIETLGIELQEGRSFSRDFTNETGKVLLNQAAIDAMQLADPVGKIISFWGSPKEVIGVTDNFHFESLFESIVPCIIRLEPRANTILVKIEQGMEQQTVAGLQHLYSSQFAGLAMDYGFLDKDYEMLYTAEQRVLVLANYFAGLAILISCMGLFGLAAFMAEQRVKEIGIRKVLGANEWNILLLVAGSFVALVLVAIGIAIPVSYFVAKNWLERFAYRVDLSWSYFAFAAVLTLLIALVTVGAHAMKSALMKPVESLRSE
ncbi:ABC transporter permease [Algoriphagus sp. Y33]|uniref:ABC transporter permease n=1 Tax=Algoriphagus sp. Y33 TaxID=2772483 RepID=UPI00177F3D7D|nr:ABC transporter permease [Algoriphagus sp. Y33]